MQNNSDCWGITYRSQRLDWYFGLTTTVRLRWRCWHPNPGPRLPPRAVDGCGTKAVGQLSRTIFPSHPKLSLCNLNLVSIGLSSRENLNQVSAIEQQTELSESSTATSLLMVLVEIWSLTIHTDQKSLWQNFHFSSSFVMMVNNRAYSKMRVESEKCCGAMKVIHLTLGRPSCTPQVLPFATESSI